MESHLQYLLLFHPRTAHNAVYVIIYLSFIKCLINFIVRGIKKVNVNERDLYRLSILKKMCEITDYNISVQIGQTQQIIQLFQIKTEEEFETFLGAITYLTQKGYIYSKLIPMLGGTEIFMIQLTAYGLDVIETIERNNSLEKYEDDFSSTSMIKLQNISNSNIIINSPNSVITLTNTIDAIKALTETADSDKEELIKQVTELSSCSDNKSKFWEKAKSVLGWVIDKGADAAIAVLPYILENMNK